MTEEQAFIAKIEENPADPLPWLVFADWFEERGDPRAYHFRDGTHPGNQSKIPRPNVGSHHYPQNDHIGDPPNLSEAIMANCSYGCGSWISDKYCGGRKGIDFVGDCPNTPNPLIDPEDWQTRLRWIKGTMRWRENTHPSSIKEEALRVESRIEAETFFWNFVSWSCNLPKNINLEVERITTDVFLCLKPNWKMTAREWERANWYQEIFRELSATALVV